MLPHTMTVREVVEMAANLRLPPSISTQAKCERVEEAIKLLGLSKSANTMIGNVESKGISAGERKRASIAMEMLGKPALLFLDEPTSGLDSSTALSVIKQLKSLSSVGTNIVVTIHQPSAKTFRMFDDLIVLAEGRIIYHGPVEGMLDYFAAQGFVCPPHTNPAEYLFMEILNYQNMIDSEAKLEKLVSFWKLSSQFEELQLSMKSIKGEDAALLPERLQESSRGTQLKFLLKRTLIGYKRDITLLTARFLQIIVASVVIGLMYYDIPGKKGFAQTQNRFTSLYFLCTNSVFTAISNAIVALASEKPIFTREYKNRYYSILPYFTSKLLLELPLGVVLTSINYSICYPLIGYRREWGSFFHHLLTGELLALVGTAIGFLLSALVPDLQAALSLMVTVIFPLVTFGGLLTDFGTDAMAKIEMTGLDFKIECGPGVPCNGDQALANADDITGRTIHEDWTILLVMFLGYLVLSVLAFKFNTRNLRK